MLVLLLGLLVSADHIELERCVNSVRPPEDCQFEALVLSDDDERELRQLIQSARIREDREAREAEREGKVTGGVWGFVSFGYRLTFVKNGVRETAWLHAAKDAAWIPGHVVFSRPESARVYRILRRAVTRPEAIVKRLPIDVTWRAASTIDLNCDGLSDRVFTGSDFAYFYVAVVADRSEATYVKFARSGDSQSSLCGDLQPLREESLDVDIIEMLGDTPEGWRRSKSCKGLRLESGDCDSFHLYWNSARNAIDWWRL